jgi:mono/diheme cytochrome c family protein
MAVATAIDGEGGVTVRRILIGVVVLLLAAGAGGVAVVWRPAIAVAAVPVPGSFAPALVRRGAELALIGNCADCHTMPGGAGFAGGLKIATPYGTIFGSNITPDAETGIGMWTQAAFRRALREGVSRDGRFLYPAFPYNHFTGMTDDDIDALYAFLMTRTPVHAVDKPMDLQFPFDQRPIMAAWNLMFLRKGPWQPDAARDAEWNRGWYLAEAVAHCGACHTPRNLFQAEDSGDRYGGGMADGWVAPALNAASTAPIPWTAAQIETYLRSGVASEHGAASGPMLAVTVNLAQAAPTDVRAIATYVASLGGTPSDARQKTAEKARAVAQGTAPAPELPGGAGGALYAGACAVCHQDGWRPGVQAQPPLALSTALNSDDPTNAIRIVMLGRQPPEGEAGAQMPGFADTFNDEQIATLLRWLRANFAHKPEWANLDGTVLRLRDQSRTPSEDP